MKNLDSLNSLLVEIYIGDPYDFTELHGSGPFLGKIIKVDLNTGRGLLIELKEVIIHNNMRLKYFKASTRYQEHTLDDLVRNKNEMFNLIHIPDARLIIEAPFALSQSQEEILLVGSISLR